MSKPSEFGRSSVESPDIFEQAKKTYRIEDIWSAFDLPGQPGKSCKSPFRKDNHPSFSVYDEGRRWKDHATSDGGDVIEFVKHALDGSHKDAREWFCERLGIDEPDYNQDSIRKRQSPASQRRIQFPGKLIEGTQDTWSAFAERRGYTDPGVKAMVEDGILRFIRAGGKKCFVVLDNELRAAEIRRIGGSPFPGGTKAYPLKGVDKSWLVGSSRLRSAPRSAAVLVTEGATDLLAAFDLFHTLDRFNRVERLWVPTALLGARCRHISSDCENLIKGRHVRLVPDDDDAGRAMAEHWEPKFHNMGCTVDKVQFGPFHEGALELEAQPNDLSDAAGRMQKLELARLLYS